MKIWTFAMMPAKRKEMIQKCLQKELQKDGTAYNEADTSAQLCVKINNR